MSSSPVNSQYGNSMSSGSLDPKDIGIDLTNLSEEAFDKIAKIIESANSIMTESEKRQKELQQKELFEYQNKLKRAIERESMKEVFIIPKDKGHPYTFIGYDTDQYERIMDFGNQSDNMARDSTKSGTLEHLKLQNKVKKLTILYSLDNIPEDIINKLPKKEIDWLYMVLKEKNENPLPFDLNVSSNGSSLKT